MNWLMNSMETLPTLGDFLRTANKEELYRGVTIDPATLEALEEWFEFRQVCDAVKFAAFYRRNLRAYGEQYTQLLRIETVKIDPMVALYFEEEIKTTHESTTTGKGTTTGSDTTTGTGETRRTGTAKTVGEGTDHRSDNSSSDSTGKTTTTAMSDSTTTGKATVTDVATEKRSGNNSTLNGDTPNSATYTGAAGKLPALNWEYTSNQSQSAISDTLDRDATRTDDNTTTMSTSSDSTANTTANGSTTATSDGTTNSSSTLTNDLTDATTNSNKTDVSRQESTNTAVTGQDVHRRRYTGRNEAPQDMLERAKKFISLTNSFMWLVDKMNECFFGVYE